MVGLRALWMPPAGELLLPHAPDLLRDAEVARAELAGSPAWSRGGCCSVSSARL